MLILRGVGRVLSWYLLRTSQLHFESCIVAQRVCDLREECGAQEDEDGHNVTSDVVLVAHLYLFTLLVQLVVFYELEKQLGLLLCGLKLVPADEQDGQSRLRYQGLSHQQLHLLLAL